MHPPPLISNHRLARLALWLLALLAWFVCGRVGERQRRRDGEVSLEKIEHAVRNLIIIRASHLLGPRKPMKRRHLVRPPRVSLRAVAGSWLRRRLRTKGDLIGRAQRLLAVLRSWRTLAAELAERRCKGLTRLSAISPKPANAAPMPARAALAPCAADTS
jgi:hypothetical protein